MKKKNVVGLFILSMLVINQLNGTIYFANEVSTSETNQSATTSSIDKYSDSTLSSSLFESSSVGQNNSEAISDSQVSSSNTKEDSVEKPFYVSITDDNYSLLKDLNGKEIDDINNIYQKTFRAEKVNDQHGKMFYFLKNIEGTVGYIDPIYVTKANGPEGVFFQEDNDYATIISDSAKLYNDNFDEAGTTSDLMNHTFKIVGFYNHYDDGKYYLLKNKLGETIGAIQASAIEKTQNPAGKKHSINDYYSIEKKDQKIWKDINLKDGKSTLEIFNKFFNAKEWYYHFDGKKYFSLYDDKGNFEGIVEEGTIKKVKNSRDSSANSQEANEYVLVTKDYYQTYSDLNFTVRGSTRLMVNKVFLLKEWSQHSNGNKYYSLFDSQDNWYGYVNAAAVTKLTDSGITWHDANEYVTVTKNYYSTYSDFNFKSLGSTKSMVDKIYLLKGWYSHSNGHTYYSLYDKNDKWCGYVNAAAAAKLTDSGITWHDANEYVTVTKNYYSTYSDFNFKSLGSTKKMVDKVYLLKGWYSHSNGHTYYSLYDNNNKWQGYVNADAVVKSENQAGIWHQTNEYVTVTKNYYSTYSDFNFKLLGSTKNMLNKTYHLQGWYHHFNGNRYYSLYDSNNKWQGYVNANAVTKAKNQGGIWHKTNEYGTITKNYYSTYSDFNFKTRGHTKNMMNKTYHLQGWYHHLNGLKYYSLYDKNNNWQGYINEAAITKANGQQGTPYSTNKSVVVIKNDYTVWSNFNWQKKSKTNSMVNKTFQVKWYYRHMNGSIYYSLYSNNNWVGYVNSTAVRERKGVADYLGTTRQRIVNELSSHQNDRFYLGTPFRMAGFSNPEMFLVPNGVSSPYGPGMNCTGFVATVTRRSGGNLNRISGITSGVGGYVNAYNWRDALMRNTEYYSFSSIDALLKSGKAQKGDLIYLEAMFTDPFYDCHIGIFWGNRSNENRFWHQVIDGNKISHIYSGTRYSKVYLFPQD